MEVSMADNKKAEEFKELVAHREGIDRDNQEQYLIRTLMAVVAERVKNKDQLSDHDVLKVLDIDKTVDVYTTIKMAGSCTIYAAVAKMLLDDSSDGLDVIRSEVTKRMQEAISRDKKIQQDAGI